MIQEDYEMQKQMQQQGMVIDTQMSREHLNQLQTTKELERQEVGLAEAQINLKEDLKLIEHILRGRNEITNKEGETIWMEPKDSFEVHLSEEGVKYIINTLKFYTSKNHLLSNYTEETILSKCEDIGIGIADELFMRSERYFNVPSRSYCQEFLMKRLKHKQKEIIESLKLDGKDYDEEQILKDLINEIDTQRELMKIHDQLKNDIYKTYYMINQKVLDFIHSTYNRALFGQERKTLRQHHTITESRTPDMPKFQPKGAGMLGFFKR